MTFQSFLFWKYVLNIHQMYIVRFFLWVSILLILEVCLKPAAVIMDGSIPGVSILLILEVCLKPVFFEMENVLKFVSILLILEVCLKPLLPHCFLQ